LAGNIVRVDYFKIFLKATTYGVRMAVAPQLVGEISISPCGQFSGQIDGFSGPERFCLSGNQPG
jgi:hypothetical protein